MISICQIFDESCDWQHRVAAAQLVDRLGSDKFAWCTASVDAEVARNFRSSLGVPIRIIPRIRTINLLAGPLLGRWLNASAVEIVHAWGPSSGAAAAFASKRPLVIELFDPRLARQHAKMLRILSRRPAFAIVCSSQTIRRRLVEHGVPAEACVTIRPAADFAGIQKMKKSGLRSALELGENDFAILLSDQISRARGNLAGFWAGALLNHLDGKHKVIVPPGAPDADRLTRFATGLKTAPTLITPDRNVPYEQLIAVSDALIMPDPGDVPTTSIAWAFAAGTAVIAAAGYAATELVVSRVNGMLYKHPADVSPALRIVPLLRDREGQRKVCEAARGQAYEVFSLRRYIEQHVQLYENLLAGRPPATGVTDPAQVA